MAETPADEEAKVPAKREPQDTEATPGKGSDESTSEASLPSEMQEFVKDMPPQVKKTFMSTMMGFTRGPMSSPLLEKLDGEHIHKFLDNARHDDDNEFELQRSARRYGVFYTAFLSLLLAALLVFLVVYLVPTDKQLLVQILVILGAFAGGFGSGYGVKSFLEGRKNT